MESIYYPEDPRYFLKNEFENRSRRRPQYSLRAFARDLELSPGALSDFLNSKMGLSKDRVYFLAKKLSLAEVQRDHWWDLIESKHSRDLQIRKLANLRAKARAVESKSRMALEQFQFISEWQHMAILELIEMSSEYHSAQALSVHLRLSLKIIKDSLKRLGQLGMIDTSEKVWKVHNEATVIEDFSSPQAVLNFHTQILSRLQNALDTQNAKTRDSQSIIMALPQSKFAELKSELHEVTVKTLMKYSQFSNKDTVYCLSSHLFSLSHQEPK